jgi:uncharacterized MnhB-related membrane protein
MLYFLIVAGMLVCAIQAIRVQRLLTSAIWLAGTSALVALLMYMLGAPELAVIELSVGAGLVTVLFVFAISIAGEETLPVQTLFPKPLAWAAILIAVALLGWLSLPALNIILPVPQLERISQVVWQTRGLDIMLQAALIFSGVLGVLGLLSPGKPHAAKEE